MSHEGHPAPRRCSCPCCDHGLLLMRPIGALASTPDRKTCQSSPDRKTAQPSPDRKTDPSLVRPADVPALVGSAAKLRAATGWTPRHSLDTILEELIRAASH